MKNKLVGLLVLSGWFVTALAPVTQATLPIQVARGVGLLLFFGSGVALANTEIKYALVGQDNVVKAVIVVPNADFITQNGNAIRAQYGDANGTWILTDGTVGKGWTYANGVFTAPVP